VPTYLDVQNEVADILNRSVFTSQIQSGIQKAIRQYEKERYWFNETVTALTCTPNVEQLAVPADYLFYTRMEIIQASAYLPMIVRPFSEIRQINMNESLGLPIRFCEYGKNFWLANVPDSAYTVMAYYVQKLPALSADTDTNDWLSAASDVIVACAAKYVNLLYIKDTSAANACAQMEQTFKAMQLDALRDQMFENRFRPTHF